MNDATELLSRLMHIGTSLTSIHDLDVLLEMIVQEARQLTEADSGSLYLAEGEVLRFTVSQNSTLLRRRGVDFQNPYLGLTVAISKDSLAGYVAETGETLNIPDVYSLPEGVPYHFNRSFDEENDYRTCSMLMAPMQDVEGKILGVIREDSR